MVVPVTVKSPPMTRLFAIVTLFGSPIVTVCPLTLVLTSSAVPAIVSV